MGKESSLDKRGYLKMHRCHWNYFLQFPDYLIKTLYVSPTDSKKQMVHMHKETRDKGYI